MQIETIMLMIPIIQVGIAAVAIAISGYMMVSGIFNKIQKRFSN